MQSVPPILVGQRRPVQLIPVQAPLRHESIHILPESIGVVTLPHVDQLVDEDVLETRRRLLG